MNFVITHLDNIYIVKVKVSRATLQESEELREILELAMEKYKNIIIELDEVNYIDSTFVGVLVITQRRINKADGHFALVGLSADVQSIVNRTNLAKVFHIFESRFEAYKFINAEKEK
jgi:anti-anti-sigma factor